MKKTLILFSLYAMLSACGGGSGSNSGSAGNEGQDSASAADVAASSRQTEVDTNVNDIGTNRSEGQEQKGSFEKGAKLISESDCLTCHKVDTKIVGPAYKDVAGKYEANDKNVEYLAGKIIKGGAGVWGDIPMTPHPNISEDDAKEMARYILSLR